MGNVVWIKDESDIRTLQTIEDALEIVEDRLGEDIALYINEYVTDLINRIDSVTSQCTDLEEQCCDYAVRLSEAHGSLNEAIQQLSKLREELVRAKNSCDEM